MHKRAGVFTGHQFYELEEVAHNKKGSEISRMEQEN